MLKSLFVLGVIGASTFASANAYAMSRSELWFLRYTLEGKLLGATGYTPAVGEGEHTVAEAERALADRGENRANLTIPQAQDLVKDCLTNCRDVTLAEKTIVSLINIMPGTDGLVAKANKLIDGLDFYDAKNCWIKVEDQGYKLPEAIERRYFPERFGGGSGGSGSGCHGAGGCPW